MKFGQLPSVARPHEKGAALLAVMAMVMLLAGFASLGLSRLRNVTDHISTSQARADANFMAQSATNAALGMVHQIKAQSRQNPQIFAKPILFQLGDGQISLQFENAGNCFNLNSLSPPKSSVSTGELASQAKAADFTKLLAAAGIPPFEASQLAASATNHLRQTGTLWADASEWAGVAGVSAKHWELAGHLLCALPNREASALNVNSLTPDKAPLLVAMGLSPDEARRALANRPSQGWLSSNDFWQNASPEGIPDTASAQVLGVTSRWIQIDVIARTPQASAGRRLIVDSLRQPATIATNIWVAIDHQSPTESLT